MNPKRIYLLLHGYMLDGKFMMDTLEQYLPKDSLIISPNGPFIVPHKKGESFFAKYSWYFFEPKQKKFFVSYEPAAKYLSELLDSIDLKLPVTVIGYSQGGFLAPKVAEFCTRIDQVIGLACIFRPKLFTKRDIEYSQIHSIEDGIVSPIDAESEFKNLNSSGKFIKIENIGHKLGPVYFKKLKSLI
jgi:predicted esterase